MNVTAKIVKFFAQGLASAIGGWPVSAANMLIGFGLSFIKSGDELGEQQIQQLKQINQNLEGIRQDLGVLDSDLEGIEETLEQILGQEKLSNWISKQNSIADALAHIETDFQNYQAFMTPTASGQLPQVPPAELDALATRAYLYPGLTDEEAITKIQQAAIGSGAGDGLLDLYTTLLIDYLSQKDLKTLTSDDLRYVANALTSYFARLLAYQVNGMAVVIECKCMNKVDPAIMTADWNGFLESVDNQSSIFLNDLWNLIVIWRNAIQTNMRDGFGGQYGLTTILFNKSKASMYSNNDLLAFLPGGPVDGSNEADWTKQNYTSTLTGPEQDYFTTAENLIAACHLSDAKARRVVLHAFFYIGTYPNDSANSAFSQPLKLLNSSVPAKVDFRTGMINAFQYPIYWVRHIFDLTADGAYQMENMRDSMPKWQGYEQVFVFQSDEDLKVTTTVNADNPVGIIHFAPYVQAAPNENREVAASYSY